MKFISILIAVSFVALSHRALGDYETVNILYPSDEEICQCVRVGYHLKLANSNRPEPLKNTMFTIGDSKYKVLISTPKNIAKSIGYGLSRGSTDKDKKNACRRAIDHRKIEVSLKRIKGIQDEVVTLHFIPANHPNEPKSKNFSFKKSEEIEGHDSLSQMSNDKWQIETSNINKYEKFLEFSIEGSDKKISIAITAESEPGSDPKPYIKDQNLFIPSN